jgi:ribosome-associated translation inhibitor RaiA
LKNPLKRKALFKAWYNQKTKVYFFGQKSDNRTLEIKRVSVAIAKTLGLVALFTNTELDRVIETFIKRIESRFNKYYHKRVKKNNGRCPFVSKTDAARLFIWRGFIHEDDFTPDINKPYTIRANHLPLVWPESFELHQDAIIKSGEIGVEGYTRAYLPKKK